MRDLRFLHSDTWHFAHRNKADFGRAETVVSTGPTVAFRLSAGKAGQLWQFQGATQNAWWMFAFRAN